MKNKKIRIDLAVFEFMLFFAGEEMQDFQKLNEINIENK